MASLKLQEDEIVAESRRMGLEMGGDDGLMKDPNVVQLIELLRREPLLRRACLVYAMEMRQKMATAQLEVLYTPSDLREMTDRISGVKAYDADEGA
jgi:hypothetical protein